MYYLATVSSVEINAMPTYYTLIKSESSLSEIAIKIATDCVSVNKLCGFNSTENDWYVALEEKQPSEFEKLIQAGISYLKV